MIGSTRSPLLFPLRHAPAFRGVPLMVGRQPLPADRGQLYLLQYYTRDGIGAILPGCYVYVFRTSDKTLVTSGNSSADGLYSFALLDAGPYFVVSFQYTITWDSTLIFWDSTAVTFDAVAQLAGATVDRLLAVRQ